MIVKTYILILVLGILYVGCNADDKPSSESDPISYSLSFKLLRPDGSSYENEEIELSSNPSNTNLTDILNGQYPFYGMGKIPSDIQNGNEFLFGVACDTSPGCISGYMPLDFASSAEGRDIGENEIWEKDKYWVLLYPNDDLDTLRINHKVRKNPYTLTFQFFVNEDLYNVTEEDFDQYYITIQK